MKSLGLLALGALIALMATSTFQLPSLPTVSRSGLSIFAPQTTSQPETQEQNLARRLSLTSPALIKGAEGVTVHRVGSNDEFSVFEDPWEKGLLWIRTNRELAKPFVPAYTKESITRMRGFYQVARHDCNPVSPCFLDEGLKIVAEFMDPQPAFLHWSSSWKPALPK